MHREVSVPLVDPLGIGGCVHVPPSLGYCASPLVMGVAGSGRELLQLSCQLHCCGWVAEAREPCLGQRWFGCRGWGWDLPPIREREHIWGLFSYLCLPASCTTGHPGRGLEITPCVLCKVHPLPNASPEGVSPAGKTTACPPAKDFVAFYLQQGRKKVSLISATT